VTQEQLAALVRQLDAHLLLENERSRQARDALAENLRAKSIRPVANPGGWYPTDPGDLRQEIAACFLSSHGPGRLPQTVTHPPVRGLLAPHGSLTLSGSCAAWGYLALAESARPDVLVVIAPNHVYNDPNVHVLTKDCETPLGRLRVDRAFIETLARRYSTRVLYDTAPLFLDHGLEMQFVFIRYVSGRWGDDVPIVPILVQGQTPLETNPPLIALRTAPELAQGLRQTARAQGKRMCVIASGDLTHYGSSYSFSPFGPQVNDQVIAKIQQFDEQRISLIVEGQAEAFFTSTQDTSYCAATPVYTTLHAIGSTETQLLSYHGVSARALDGSDLFTSFACILMR
jgi:AmmeMemoRadiSam system protein B